MSSLLWISVIKAAYRVPLLSLPEEGCKAQLKRSMKSFCPLCKSILVGLLTFLAADILVALLYPLTYSAPPNVLIVFSSFSDKNLLARIDYFFQTAHLEVAHSRKSDRHT